MQNVEKKAERLKVVASRLGNSWCFNSVLSKDNTFFLSNRGGLYIKIQNRYGEKLEQWSLCIKDPNYRDNILSVISIGCNLSKSYSAIVSDLKNRLLIHESIAYKKIKNTADEKVSKERLLESRGFVLQALNRVLHIKKSNRFCGDHYTLFDSEDCKIGGFELLHKHVDKFDLNLHSVSSSEIISIMNLLQKNKENNIVRCNE